MKLYRSKEKTKQYTEKTEQHSRKRFSTLISFHLAPFLALAFIINWPSHLLEINGTMRRQKCLHAARAAKKAQKQSNIDITIQKVG